MKAGTALVIGAVLGGGLIGAAVWYVTDQAAQRGIRSEVEALEQQRDEALEDYRLAKDTLSNTLERAEKWQQELKNLRELLKQHVPIEELDAAKAQLAEAQRQATALADRLTTQAADFEKKLAGKEAELTQELEKQQARLEATAENLKKASAELADLSAERDRLAATLTKTTEQLETRTKELNNAQQRIEDLGAKVERLEKRVAELTKLLAQGGGKNLVPQLGQKPEAEQGGADAGQ